MTDKQIPVTFSEGDASGQVSSFTCPALHPCDGKRCIHQPTTGGCEVVRSVFTVGDDGIYRDGVRMPDEDVIKLIHEMQTNYATVCSDFNESLIDQKSLLEQLGEISKIHLKNFNRNYEP